MNTASDYVKFGGCLGFSVVFLVVLLKYKDVVGALMDASIACVIMALVFKQLHHLTVSLERNVLESKKSKNADTNQENKNSELNPLTDGQLES